MRTYFVRASSPALFVPLLCLLAGGLLGGCQSPNHGGTTTIPAAPGTPEAPLLGVQYALPRTVLQVTIPVTQRRGKEDPCTAYREVEVDCGAKGPQKLHECLGLPVLHNAKSGFSPGAPRIGSRAEADPDAVFALPLTGSKLDERLRELELTESGLLTKGTSKVVSKRFELFSGIFRSV
ncbi:MAG: hypothetical protein MI919_27125, partial [Holophagales bacterium]|nr:hypothetical protein [Holophagales bacterium]